VRSDDSLIPAQAGIQSLGPRFRGDERLEPTGITRVQSNFPLIPAKAGIQFRRQMQGTGSPPEFIPEMIGDGDERSETRES
jgi:hypothetical protein